MNTALVLALLAVAISLLVVLMARRSGPRITTIETHRDDKPDDDENKA